MATGRASQTRSQTKARPKLLVVTCSGSRFAVLLLRFPQVVAVAPSFLTTTSYVVTQTLQPALQQLPPTMLPHYTRQSLNGVGAGPSVMPTPPLGTRKRKRAHQYTVSYSEVQEVDSTGRLREVIVIEDTPPPATISPATTHNGGYSASYQPPLFSAPVRTRARAAAEAQALSASTSSAIVAPAPKKRKREPDQNQVRAPVLKKPAIAAIQPTQSSWDSRSGAATEDVRDAHSSIPPITY